MEAIKVRKWSQIHEPQIVIWPVSYVGNTLVLKENKQVEFAEGFP